MPGGLFIPILCSIRFSSRASPRAVSQWDMLMDYLEVGGIYQNFVFLLKNNKLDAK